MKLMLGQEPSPTAACTTVMGARQSPANVPGRRHAASVLTAECLLLPERTVLCTPVPEPLDVSSQHSASVSAGFAAAQRSWYQLSKLQLRCGPV